MSNKLMIEKLADLGIAASVEKNKTHGVIMRLEGSLDSALSYMDSIKQLPFTSDMNQAVAFGEVTKTEKLDWVGGTEKELRDDLSGKIDLRPFQKERKRLEESGLLGKLTTTSADLTPKRKRRNSEHDGEWDMARKYEIQPFASTHRIMQAERTLDIVCNFGISGYADAESITRFGVFCWSIVDIIESAGIRCNLFITEDGTAIDVARGHNTNRIKIQLKKASEYVSPSLLAAAFTCNFKRRLLFSMIPLCADLGDYAVSLSLGRPISVEDAAKFENGVLTLSPNAAEGMTAELEKQLLEAIEWKGNEHDT